MCRSAWTCCTRKVLLPLLRDARVLACTACVWPMPCGWAGVTTLVFDFDRTLVPRHIGVFQPPRQPLTLSWVRRGDCCVRAAHCGADSCRSSSGASCWFRLASLTQLWLSAVLRSCPAVDGRGGLVLGHGRLCCLFRGAEPPPTPSHPQHRATHNTKPPTTPSHSVP